MSQFSDSMTLAQARALLRTLVADGHKCPCCTQFAKVYKRKLNSSMAIALIKLFRAGAADDFVHGPSISRSHELGQLQWWGLIDDEHATRSDGGRTGWWKVTALGKLFVRGQLSVSQYARIYDGRCLGLEGEKVTIQNCLNEKFDYHELMAA